MSLELVNTFGTLLTVAIIAATAIAAMVQLRHLRAGNQINAMLTIGDQIDRREFQDAVTLVYHKLQSALEDPAYRDYVLARNRRLPLPSVSEEYRELHTAAVRVGNTYEELGILAKNNIIERDMFLDRYSFNITSIWNALSKQAAWIRAVAGKDAIWENFEYLTVLAEDFIHDHASMYPKGARRLHPHNPWPLPPIPATA